DYGWWQSAPDLGLPGYPPGAPNAEGANYNGLADARQRDPVSGALPLRSFACDVERIGSGPWRGTRAFEVVERVQETQD
ncbi:hypothetical protein KC216_22445, partial [Mycobacterium tuberculosis]|uniref:hypothetical protein n=1 Tax=Mycobacterium tuberculosis TaxID=1773 RepID=UPI001B822FB2